MEAIGTTRTDMTATATSLEAAAALLASILAAVAVACMVSGLFSPQSQWTGGDPTPAPAVHSGYVTPPTDPQIQHGIGGGPDLVTARRFVREEIARHP